MTTAEEKVGTIKFDGDENHWHEWSVKALALAKSKGFRHVYANDTKPCSDAVYLTSTHDEEKKKYEDNDKAYQFLILSCTGIAFGLVNHAKTKDLIDGDAFLGWKNLNDRYAPNEASDLIQLAGEFNKCNLKDTKQDPDELFIKLDNIRNRMIQIDIDFEKKDAEVIAHIIDKLPGEYSEVITMVEGVKNVTLTEIKAKIRAFYKRKFKTTDKNEDELALFVGGKFKGNCRNCGKQGHKAAECRSKVNTAGVGNKKRAKDDEAVGKGVK